MTKVLQSQKYGEGRLNKNKPYGHNPFIFIPADVDRNPFRLAWIDILSVFERCKLLPLLLIPCQQWISGPLDELYPNWANLKDIFLHVVLTLSQLALLLTLPIVTFFCLFLPGVVPIIYFAVFSTATLFVMRLLNGGPRAECLVGVPEGVEPVNGEDELWFYINGIATGKTWLQSNLTLLARTFQREIVGIHNPTKGVLLDLVECIIQRDFDYKSADIRQGRAQLRSALGSGTTKKVVLILHSQGGIEGSSILDYLFADLSYNVMSKLEIYTFGNAARRFNNPLVHQSSPKTFVDQGVVGAGTRVIKHIEHYANSEDFVANIGVLNFTSPAAQPFADGNAFFGPVFIRKGSGHLLNIHYLDNMFRMVDGRVDEQGNAFMNTIVSAGDTKGATVNGQPLMIKDFSRLWQYINGGRPEEENENGYAHK